MESAHRQPRSGELLAENERLHQCAASLARALESAESQLEWAGVQRSLELAMEEGADPEWVEEEI